MPSRLHGAERASVFSEISSEVETIECPGAPGPRFAMLPDVEDVMIPGHEHDIHHTSV